MRDFFASCPKGLEYLLVDELKALGGADVHEALAGVHFRGELGIGYAACLWSRLASMLYSVTMGRPPDEQIGNLLAFEAIAPASWREYGPAR